MMENLTATERILFNFGFPILLNLILLGFFYKIGVPFLTKLEAKLDKIIESTNSLTSIGKQADLITQSILTLNQTMGQFIVTLQNFIIENNRQWDRWERRFEMERNIGKSFWEAPKKEG